jgi:hypothetical protein
MPSIGDYLRRVNSVICRRCPPDKKPNTRLSSLTALAQDPLQFGVGLGLRHGLTLLLIFNSGVLQGKLKICQKK